MAQRISFKVHGLVQGVNFRAWTTEQANAINVTGWVRNADDGTVIGEAQGDQATLDKFVKHLHTGPSAAKVESVSQDTIDTKTDENTFQQFRR